MKVLTADNIESSGWKQTDISGATGIAVSGGGSSGLDVEVGNHIAGVSVGLGDTGSEGSRAGDGSQECNDGYDGDNGVGDGSGCEVGSDCGSCRSGGRGDSIGNENGK